MLKNFMRVIVLVIAMIAMIQVAQESARAKDSDSAQRDRASGSEPGV